jgi:hypothetical protein
MARKHPVSPNQLAFWTLFELHERPRAWAIGGPLRAVNKGQQRVLWPPRTRRSEVPTSHGRRSSKLVMRVRFPSPARSWVSPVRGERSPGSLAISCGGAAPTPRPAGFAPGPPISGLRRHSGCVGPWLPGVQLLRVSSRTTVGHDKGGLADWGALGQAGRRCQQPCRMGHLVGDGSTDCRARRWFGGLVSPCSCASGSSCGVTRLGVVGFGGCGGVPCWFAFCLRFSLVFRLCCRPRRSGAWGSWSRSG